MFVITAAWVNFPVVEDSLIRICLSPRRKGAKFGGEGKIFSQMIFTIFLRPLRPWRLCERYSEFRLRLFAGGEPLFPSPVWEKACTSIFESFRGSGKLFPLPVTLQEEDLLAPSRQARKERLFVISTEGRNPCFEQGEKSSSQIPRIRSG